MCRARGAWAGRGAGQQTTHILQRLGIFAELHERTAHVVDLHQISGQRPLITQEAIGVRVGATEFGQNAIGCKGGARSRNLGYDFINR